MIGTINRQAAISRHAGIAMTRAMRQHTTITKGRA
jgi:hypothetical protein